MRVTITVSEGIARHLNSLSFDQAGDIDIKLRILLEAEYRRRLARHSLTDQELARKHGMSFEEFEKRQMTRQKGYSWEVESDAVAWETATEGVRTVRRQLAELNAER